MVGIIVTGHGHFATGVTSSVDLIAGPQKDYVAVDFDGTGEEKLTEDLKNALEQLKDCNGILVFSDLPGGSPFKMSVMLTQGNANVEVIGGTNLPMLCEIVMARGFVEDVHSLCDMALNTGKEQVVKFELQAPVNNEPEDGDGI